MSQQIEELNLTIPDALDIVEQQKVLIENFSLLRDLVVTSGYVHAHRHKDTPDSLTVDVYHQFSNFNHKSAVRKHIDFDLTEGEILTELNGVYTLEYFIDIAGAGTNEYEMAFREGTSVLSSHVFDIHGGGGESKHAHSFIQEFDEPKLDLNLAIKCLTGAPSVTFLFLSLYIQRVDNYNIP